MKIKMLGTLVLCTASMQASADAGHLYWSGSDGEFVRSRDGHCVRATNWTPDHTIASCEGGKVAAAPMHKPAPVAKPKHVAKPKPMAKPAPKPVAKPAPVAPRYTNLSLASGASFKTGGSTLSGEGKAAVRSLLSRFHGETIDSIVVEGYTDSLGAAAFNQQLSEKRANAVKAELIANGVAASRISTIGYGESNPIASNGTRAGRAENRRVIVKIDGRQRKL